MVGIGEAAAAASVFGAARKILGELMQAKLSAEHRALVEQAMEVVTDGQERLAELQGRIIALQEEKQDLLERLRKVESWEQKKAGYELHRTQVGGLVWKSIDATVEHYACPTCAESRKEIHVLQPAAEWSGTYDCMNCGKGFDIQPRKPTRWT